MKLSGPFIPIRYPYHTARAITTKIKTKGNKAGGGSNIILSKYSAKESAKWCTIKYSKFTVRNLFNKIFILIPKVFKNIELVHFQCLFP